MSKQILYCFIKKTDYEHFQNDDVGKRKFNKMSKSFQLKVINNHHAHYKLLDYFNKVIKIFELNAIFESETNLKKIKTNKNDIVISIGGDGTFLSCAQSFPNNLLLGINSSHNIFDIHSGSIGALTKVNINNLETTFGLIAKNKFLVEIWNRISVSVNDIPIKKYAINDIYLGHKSSFLTSNLTIKVDNKSSDFNCSGLIVCTGMGSHAWFSAAGGSSFSNDIIAFGYMVLLPSPKWKYQFTSGIANEKSIFYVIPHRDNYVLSFDSKTNVNSLKAGDIVKFFIALDNPLHVISPGHYNSN